MNTVKESQVLRKYKVKDVWSLVKKLEATIAEQNNQLSILKAQAEGLSASNKKLEKYNKSLTGHILQSVEIKEKK